MTQYHSINALERAIERYNDRELKKLQSRLSLWAMSEALNENELMLSKKTPA